MESKQSMKLPANVEGGEKMARFWIYDHPDEDIPSREARTIAKALIDLMRLHSNQEARDD